MSGPNKDAFIRVPQMGEGLREARILSLLRVPGEQVSRGDALYVIETDKSTVELEAPEDGVLVRWFVGPGDIVPTNGVVAELRKGAEISAPAPASFEGQALVPPRTKAYAEQRGLTDAQMAELKSIVAGKVLPRHVDEFLVKGSPSKQSQAEWLERAVSPAQRLLIYRLRRSAGLVIPGTVSTTVAWRNLVAASYPDGLGRPSPVQVFAHGVARAAQRSSIARSIMVGDDTVREFHTANIGLALSRPDDELIVALIRDAGRMSLPEFARACRARMREAIKLGDQASDDMQILISHLGAERILDAVPSLVSPASSVFFLGSPDDEGIARVSLTFDHRLMNGMGAARLLLSAVDQITAPDRDVQ